LSFTELNGGMGVGVDVGEGEGEGGNAQQIHVEPINKIFGTKF
jgi:hypothetical protein